MNRFTSHTGQLSSFIEWAPPTIFGSHSLVNAAYPTGLMSQRLFSVARRLFYNVYQRFSPPFCVAFLCYKPTMLAEKCLDWWKKTLAISNKISNEEHPLSGRE